MSTALKGGEWSAARPGRTLALGKTRYPLYRRLDGPQGRSGRAENLALPGFDPLIIQPVALSLYRLSYPAQQNHTNEIPNHNFHETHERTFMKLQAKLLSLLHDRIWNLSCNQPMYDSMSN